jgi:glycosyltransferase involved in cell wall biosynthesis
MHNSTRISIVTPSYNQGKYIGRTIQSVLSQEVQGLDYAVIDGGSADETISILKRYEDRFFWISQRDRGPSDAINRGFNRSSGPVLGWLNSDDIYYPGALQTVLEFFDENPDVDVMYGDAYHIDENDEIIEKYPTEDWDWERLKETCFISQPAAFFRRRVIDEYGPLEVGVRCMDYEYWLRLGKNGVRFAHVPKLLAATRLHKDAFTIAGRVAGHGEVNTFTRKHLSRTPDRWLCNYGHAVAEARGYHRSQPLPFVLTLVCYSVYAAFRWNRRVSSGLIKVLYGWLRDGLVQALRSGKAK